MCFKLGMCFGGGEDYCRATTELNDGPTARAPNGKYHGHRAPGSDETGRKANNDVPWKDHAVAAATVAPAAYQQERKTLYAPADETLKPPAAAAARNNKVADDTAVKPTAILRYTDQVY